MEMKGIEKILQKAYLCMQIHQHSVDTWTHGNIVDAYIKKDGMVIKYKDGSYWRYRLSGVGLTWRKQNEVSRCN